MLKFHGTNASHGKTSSYQGSGEILTIVVSPSTLCCAVFCVPIADPLLPVNVRMHRLGDETSVEIRVDFLRLKAVFPQNSSAVVLFYFSKVHLFLLHSKMTCYLFKWGQQQFALEVYKWLMTCNLLLYFTSGPQAKNKLDSCKTFYWTDLISHSTRVALHL